MVDYSHKRFKVVFCHNNKRQQKQSNGQNLNLRFFTGRSNTGHILFTTGIVKYMENNLDITKANIF